MRDAINHLLDAADALRQASDTRADEIATYHGECGNVGAPPKDSTVQALWAYGREAEALAARVAEILEDLEDRAA